MVHKAKEVVLLGLKIAYGQQGQAAQWEQRLRAELPGEHWKRNTYAVIAEGPGINKLFGVLASPTQDSGEGTLTWVTPNLARANAIFGVLQNAEKVSCWLFFREQDYPTG